MNLHGYKQSHKGMVRMLKEEKAKKEKDQNFMKINRLEKAKNNCAHRIKILKQNKEQAK